jgi:hypothetical protein
MTVLPFGKSDPAFQHVLDANEFDDVVVTGGARLVINRPFIGGGGTGGGGLFPGGGGGIYFPEDPAINNPGEGYGNTPAPTWYSFVHHLPDSYIDEIAEEVRDVILSQPDAKDREYGAIIYLNHTTGRLEAFVIPGTKGNPPSVEYTARVINTAAAYAGGVQNFVGMIHSHPDNYYAGRSSEQNALSRPDVSAGKQFRDMVVNEGGYAPILRQYVVGTAGTISEYGVF